MAAVKLNVDLFTVSVAVPPPCCVTATVREFPPPLTVIVAVRCDVAVLASAITVMVSLFEPEVGSSVSHVAEPLSTVQLVLEVIINVLFSPPAAKFMEAVDRVKVEAPACVTAMVCEFAPALTVIVPVRCPDVLAEALTVNVPEVVPEVGVSVSHVAEPLSTVQLVLELMVTVRLSAAVRKVSEEWETFNDEADWLRVMVRVIPPPLTVIVAVRAVWPVLLSAVIWTVPLFEPDVGVTVNHVSEPFVTVQSVFDSIVNGYVAVLLL